MNEIDREVATKAMKWHEHTASYGVSYWVDENDSRIGTVEGFTPSEDIADAWMVVDKLLSFGYYVQVDCWNDEKVCTISGIKIPKIDMKTGKLLETGARSCKSKTVSLAICKAALKAVEGR